MLGKCSSTELHSSPRFKFRCGINERLARRSFIKLRESFSNEKGMLFQNYARVKDHSNGKRDQHTVIESVTESSRTWLPAHGVTRH